MLRRPLPHRSSSPRRPRWLAAPLLAAAGLVGCAPLPPTDPPPTFLLSWLDAQAVTREQAYERKQGRLRIESSALSGTFRLALVRRRGPDPAVRLQLFPEVGGRVLDLAASATSFAGRVPQADLDVRWTKGEGKVPRHLFSFLAASLLEEGVPLDATRALGAAPGPAGTWRVQLETTFTGLDLVGTFDEHGAVEGFDYTLRDMTWSEESRRPDRQRRFVGQDFELVVLEEIATPTGPLDDALFHLDDVTR